MGISERKHHIQVLEQFLHDYKEWGEDSELEQTIEYAISSLKTDEAYQIMYEGGEIFTKDEVIEKLKNILDAIIIPQMSPKAMRGFNWCYGMVEDIIHQEIADLRGDESDK